MSKSTDQLTATGITVVINEPVTANILLVTTTQYRTPTDDELRSAGYVSKRWLHSRMVECLAHLGIRMDTEDDTESALRYFLEYVAVYDHEIPEMEEMILVIQRSKRVDKIEKDIKDLG
jgi:hypothetical protein